MLLNKKKITKKPFLFAELLNHKVFFFSAPRWQKNSSLEVFWRHMRTLYYRKVFISLSLLSCYNDIIAVEIKCFIIKLSTSAKLLYFHEHACMSCCWLHQQNWETIKRWRRSKKFPSDTWPNEKPYTFYFLLEPSL